MSQYTNVLNRMTQALKLKFGGQLLDKACALCQDMDTEVRKIMAQEVVLKITFAVGKDLAELKMLDKVGRAMTGAAADAKNMN